MNKKSILSLALFASLCCTAAYAKDYTVHELNTGADGMYVFEPGYLHIQPGDSVRFVASDVGHQVQSFLVPNGAQGWSGEVSKDITVKFAQQGVYLYQCLPHHLLGMFGVIQVGTAVNKAQAQKAAADMDKQAVMNKDRLDKLMKKID